MATSTDYDTPRRPLVELDESVPDLRAARSGQAPTIDVDDPIDDFELPGAEVADLGDGELTVTVVPMRSDEFRCSTCFLVHHRSQRVQTRDGRDLCRECA